MGEVGWSEWLSMMSSLAVVLVLLAATLFGLKKMGLSSVKDLSKKLQVSEVHNLGPRQKLIVVTINNEQILLGVTPQAINRLGNWPDQKTADRLEQSVAIESADPEPATENAGTFQQLLTQVADRTTARKKL
jgi:flagellar protein FliO/FliZ